MSELSKHQPVLLQEVLNFLKPKTGGTYLDATFGGGGHSRAILEASRPDGRVVAIDRDPNTEGFAQPLKEEFGDRFEFRVLPFNQLDEIGQKFDGIILDLGLSSDQLDSPASASRGFSFQTNEPLDMRFNPEYGQTAGQFLNQASLTELETVLRELAEDRYWKGLAAKIVRVRKDAPFRTTQDLVRVVGSNQPKILAPIFQAIRITVNQELEILKRALDKVPLVLKPEGRIVIISFHSGEDRMVKNFFRNSPFTILTKKPMSPTKEEMITNPRSRSAKLRAGQLEIN